MSALAAGSAPRDASGNLPARALTAAARLLRSPVLWGPLAVSVITLALWQGGAFHALFGFKVFTVPYPDRILADLQDNVDVLARGVAITVPAAITGYAIGMVLGFAVATALVLFAPGAAARVVAILSSANALPIVALAPLGALWIGTGFWLKVLIVVIMTTPSMTVYGVRGLTNVDPVALELMASYEARENQVYRMLRVPRALPFLFTALKACVVLALIGTIVSEVVGGFEGLGFIIQDSLGAFQAARGWSALLTIAALGIGWYVAIEALERVVVPWESAARQRE